MTRGILFVLLLLVLSGCASRSRLISTTPGPVGLIVEIWRNPHTQTCERRVYVGWSYYGTQRVPCPTVPATE